MRGKQSGDVPAVRGASDETRDGGLPSRTGAAAGAHGGHREGCAGTFPIHMEPLAGLWRCGMQSLIEYLFKFFTSRKFCHAN